MFNDILFAALTYPDATPERAIRSAAALTKRLDGALTLMTVTTDIPDVGNAVSNALFDFDRLAAHEEGRSARRADREARCAKVAAEELGVGISVRNVEAPLYFELETVVTAARTRDITLVSIGPAVLADRSLAEATLLGSGRPILVFPEEREIAPADKFDCVLVAWNGSPQSARALADALPILRRAKRVHALVIVEEKRNVTAELGEELARHLHAHGVEVRVRVRSGGAGQADLLREELESTGADLLVMGGYGRTRIREAVLGGVTDAMLSAPPCATLLSH